MEFEVTNTVKLIAAAVAILAAYLSPSDWLKTLLSKLNPVKGSPVEANTVRVDEAARILLQDARTRQCRQSVQLLNDWLELRNLHGIPPVTPAPPAPPVV